MVCEHRKGQPAECMEDSLWCQHIPVEGVVLRPELRHLGRWQIHCDRIRWQEGHRLRGHLLRVEAPALLQHFYWDDFTFSPWPTICGLQRVEANCRFLKLFSWKSETLSAWGSLYWKVVNFFCPFVVEGLFLGCTFLWLFFLLFGIFGCNPVKRRFISEKLVAQTSCAKCTYWIK